MYIDEYLTDVYKSVPNPNYNSRSKKNPQPKTIQQLNVIPNQNKYVQLGINDYASQKRFDKNLVDKYAKAGITYNDWENFDKLLSESQSAGSKLFNAALQSVWSELALGTLKSFTDIGGWMFTGFDRDGYTNAASAKIEEWQENFNNEHPIYADPDINITNGGLFDIGYLASNLPSIVTTLTLFVPSLAITKGAKALSAITRFGKGVGYLRKSITGANKILEAGEAAKKTVTAEELIADLGKTKAWINGAGTEAANAFVETGLNTATMRFLENYQESRDVYKNMKDVALEKFKYMTDNEFQEFCSKNDNIPNDLEGGLTKDNVANYIAQKSANTTFANDWWNVIFDFVQLKALQGAGKVNKNVAQRSAAKAAERKQKEAVAKELSIGIDSEAKESLLKSIGKNTKNFINDHTASGKILLTEISEGVEEGVNFVAQQEGLHFGNVMLGEEDENTFGERFSSYLNNSALYDSMFWGWMGGILFEGVGSKIKTFSDNVIDKAISNINNKNKNKATGEKSTTFNDLFSTATTKRQVSEIESRLQKISDANEKLQQINDGKNPFKKLEDGETLADIDTEEEAKELRNQVYNDVISSLTLDAIDAGNFKALKDFITDKTINEKLKKDGIISDENGLTTEQIISKMDEVAKLYSDNFTAVNVFSNASSVLNGRVPLEYQQIIARDNTRIKLRLQDIDKQIEKYDLLSEQHKAIFAESLKDAGIDADMDYKSSVFAVEAATRLAGLKAKRDYLMKHGAEDNISALEIIREIDYQINAINELLKSTTDDPINNIANYIWAHYQASFFEYDETTDKVIESPNSSKFVKVKEILDRVKENANVENVKELSDALNIDFEISDDNITKLFGKAGEKDGQFNITSNNMELLFTKSKHKASVSDINKEQAKTLEEAAPLLHEDLRALAYLGLSRVYQEARLANTKSRISNKIQYLDNYKNKARVKAKEKAFNIIFDLEDKYGLQTVLNYVHDHKNNSIEGITTSEKKFLDDAITILDLTSEANLQLMQDLIKASIMHMASKRSTETEETKQNDSDTTSSESKETSQPATTPNPAPAEPIPEPASLDIAQAKGNINTESGKFTFGLDLDKKLVVIQHADTNENPGVKLIDETDGTITIDVKDINNDILKNAIEPDAVDFLFAVNDTRINKSAEGITKVTKNPVIRKEDDGSYTVVSKGIYEIASKSISTSSTGEVNELNPEERRRITEEEKLEQERTDIIDPLVSKAINSALKEKGITIDTLDDIDNATKQDIITEAINKVKAFSSYNAETDEKILEKSINTYKEILEVETKENDFKSDVKVIVHSTITESEVGKFSDNYIQAVSKLVDTYRRQYSLPQIDGKTYINLEQLFRDINNEFTNDIADLVYKQMIAYITSQEGQEKYVVTDLNPKAEDFIDRVHMTKEQSRRSNIMDESIQRIALDELNEEDKKRTKEEQAKLDRLERLKEGEVLKAEAKVGRDEKDNLVGDIIIKSDDDIELGRLPLAKHVLPGVYEKWNQGWYCSISNTGSEYQSDAKDAIIELLSDDKHKEFRNKLYKYSYDKLTKKKKEDLAKEIKDYIDDNFNSLIHSKANAVEVANFISTISKYSNVLSTNNINDIDDSVNEFFEKLWNSYNTAQSLYESISKNSGAYEIVVDKYVKGSINRYEEGPNGLVPYSDFGFLGDVLSDEYKANDGTHNVIVGMMNSEGTGIIIKDPNTGSITTVSHIATPGAPYVILSNGTIPAFCAATTVNLQEIKNLNSVKDIYKTIQNNINYLVERAIADPTKYGEELVNFLYKLAGTDTNSFARNKETIKYAGKALKVTNPLLTKIKWIISGNFLKIQANGVIVQFPLKNSTYDKFQITKNGTRTDTKNKQEVVNALMEILDSGKFNMTTAMISQIDASNPNNGFVLTGKNSYTISIPNLTSENNDYTTLSVQGTITDFYIKHKLLKVNLYKDKKGSNFTTRGTNNRDNRLLQVKINRTSPVEDSKEETQMSVITPEQEALNILNDNSITDKATEFVKLVPELKKSLNVLKSLGLLPKNIIFDENLNEVEVINGITYYRGDNAQAILSNGEVHLGYRWIAMFSGTGEFANNPEGFRVEAIKKLIHEQLHLRLNTRNKQANLERLGEIYDDFEKALEKATDEDKKEFTPYLFKDYSRENAIEEFFVESLTNNKLANYLNTIDATYDKTELKMNLWQKILKALAKILGIDIKSGKLLEKELYVLQKEIKHFRTKKKNNTNNIELETSQTEENIEEQKEEQPEETKTEPKEEKSDKTPVTDDGFLSDFDDLEDGLDENNYTNDVKKSTITETETIKHSSITENVTHPIANLSAYTRSLPLSIQSRVIGEIEQGERKISCKV